MVVSRPRNPKNPIPYERAHAVVTGAPGQLGQAAIIEHVLQALRSAYDDGKRDGACEARETMLRSQLAFYEGNAQRSAGSANEVRNELNELLDAMGKTRVVPP